MRTTRVTTRKSYTRVRIDFDYELRAVLAPSKQARSRFVEVRLPARLGFVPRHTAGDKDFYGHGPRVTINARLVQSSAHVALGLDMRAQESGAVNEKAATRNEGSTIERLYTAPRGWRIKKIHGRTNWQGLVNELMTSQSKRFDTEIGELIVWGDHKGDDTGSFTRLELESNYSFRVELEPNPEEGEVLDRGPRRYSARSAP